MRIVVFKPVNAALFLAPSPDANRSTEKSMHPINISRTPFVLILFCFVLIVHIVKYYEISCYSSFHLAPKSMVNYRLQNWSEKSRDQSPEVLIKELIKTTCRQKHSKGHKGRHFCSDLFLCFVGWQRFDYTSRRDIHATMQKCLLLYLSHINGLRWHFCATGSIIF